jgi:hypothetical protein
MKITMEIPDYDPHKGFKYIWEYGFEISTEVRSNTIQISANKEGLISLAKHLLTLSEMPVNGHIHYDEFNSLEDGSIELIIERVTYVKNHTIHTD